MRYERALQEAENDPALKHTHKYYEWTREEIQYNWMKRLHHLYHKDKKFYFLERPDVQFNWMWLYFGQSPISIHTTMFTESVGQFSTQEQYDYWMPKCLNVDIIGCYA